jgi:hypothetical protein
MSTRSAIAVAHNGVIKGVYCHNQGYPEHVGRCLKDNYDFYQTVQLIAHGNMSSLGKRVVPAGPHSFKCPEQDTTVFYGRDRGEKNVDWMNFYNAEDFVSHYDTMGCEFFYVLSVDCIWYVRDKLTSEWKKVSDVLESVTL